jgi:predicted enzyme related to lactoylglutathione lyase
MAVAFQADKPGSIPQSLEFFEPIVLNPFACSSYLQTINRKKNMNTSEKKQAASIVWFEIPAENPERAKSFYSDLFGWKINPFPGTGDYWHIDTGGADDTPDGALMVRKDPQQPITNYVSVDSVSDFSKKIEKLGGKICLAKTTVPQMGYFAVCQDTEGNTFGIWQSDANAK